MAATTIWFGIILILLGLVGYFGSGGVSVTALIPAGFGVVLTALGFAARSDSSRRHAMHAAAALGLLGFLGTVPGLLQLPTLLAGGNVARPPAVISQSIMALLMVLFVGLCVKSFIDARKARERSV